MNKLLVTGLDGATFDVIDKLVAAGEMPFTAGLLEKGTRARLRSTTPPYTPVAWSTYLTGLNPGKHGIFDFLQFDPAAKKLKLATASDRRGPTIAARLSADGMFPVLINVPFTFPPDKTGGNIISGIDAPGVQSGFTYPAELYSEIREHVGEYRLHDYRASGRKAAEYLPVLESVLKNRLDTAAYLLRNRPWDFFMVVFSVTDHVQHFFWDESSGEIPQPIRRIFRLADDAMAELASLAPGGTSFAVMSDHGMGPLRARVNINRKLLESGFLALREPARGRASLYGALGALKKLARRKLPPGVRDRLRIMLPGLEEKAETGLAFANFDWEKTTAFATGFYGNIYLQHPVSPETKDRLRKELTAWIPPGLEEPPIEDLVPGPELYPGGDPGTCPDFVPIWRGWEFAADQAPPDGPGGFTSGPLPVDGSDMFVKAVHRMDGILILEGDPFAANAALADPTLADLAPTFLHLLGRPVPDTLDGRVLEEAFEPDRLAERPVRTCEDILFDPGPAGERFGHTAAEREEVEERLRGLGYIE